MSFYNENYHTAVKLLSKFLKVRDRASCEVRSFFISKGYSLQEAELLVEECIQRGIINDKRFLENFVYSYQKKLYGRFYIEKKLLELGMEETQVLDFLDKIPNQTWLEICEDYARKIFTKEKFSKKEIKNLIQKLFSRGFDEEIIFFICKKLNLNIKFWDEINESF